MNQTRVTKGVKAVILNKEEWTLALHFVEQNEHREHVDFFVLWSLFPVFEVTPQEFYLCFVLLKRNRNVDKHRMVQTINRRITVTVECTRKKRIISEV